MNKSKRPWLVSGTSWIKRRWCGRNDDTFSIECFSWDHRLRLVKDHHAILTARVIVGKPSRQTPEINSKVTRIILNPYWTLPPGIACREIIPKAMREILTF